MKKLIIVLAIMLVGCTDAELASIRSLRDEADIKCYSGGQVIFADASTGKIIQGDGGGLIFKSKSTDKLVRAYADCIILAH